MNAKDKLGNTALYYACEWGNLDFINFLIKKQTDCNIRCSNGNTPVHMVFKS